MEDQFLGYEALPADKFIHRVLNHRNGGVQPLLDLTGGERDWLEFKAALELRPGDLKRGRDSRSL